MEASDPEYSTSFEEAMESDDAGNPGDEAGVQATSPAGGPAGSPGATAQQSEITEDTEQSSGGDGPLSDEDVGDFDDGMDEDDEEDDDEDDDDEEDEEDEEEEASGEGAGVHRPISVQEFLAWRLLGRPPPVHSRDDTMRKFTPYEDAVPRALQPDSDLWQQIRADTGPAGLGRGWRGVGARLDSGLDVSVDASLLSSHKAPYGKNVRQRVAAAVRANPGLALSSGAWLLGPDRTAAAADGASVAAATATAATAAAGCAGPVDAADPAPPATATTSASPYCAHSSAAAADGAGAEDRRVRLYDVERGWRLRKDITTRMCRWTITDTSISPDQRFVIYSSIIPIVHLVEVGSQYDCVSSIANITQVWDRRTMPATPSPGSEAASTSGRASGRSARPAGVLVGHTEGLTHLHSRGDGRHVLSNAKDQTAKLWDIRSMRTGGSLRDPAAAARLPSAGVPRFNWDYRWQEYPGAGRVVRHPHDASVQTYRGHSVQHTLIRAYFSPAHSTGQRYVYTGSVSGAVHVYDVVSGQEVSGSPWRLHGKLVRDVSWHPYEPQMATVSWDGTVVRWDAVPPPDGTRPLQVPATDAYDYY
ncbi:hypothetical protein GPECTOR_12g365 [Gonium pectorale]|uniref:LEC14B protein n=1 Tax=Gonium pectorale TaxID=33097 RepID=A0A150GNI5_GONPE|nr:hypothetical protein GPECTOR_12g365 [Gonium pectorale]|eukprot:KXZ51403.1 hypothetical protein GPECTOR_12g365 [Gonium pectorale]